MAPRILIVDNAVHRHLFRPHWPWKAHFRGVAVDVINLPASRNVPSLDGYTHLLLTGSEASILRPKPWFEREGALIRAAIGKGLPILGSCFGHQMLVYTLSGPGFLRKATTPEIGWTDVEMSAFDPLFQGIANPWRTFVYHFDEAAPPPPWRILGRSKACEAHVIRFGDLPVWGLQAHPEISSVRAKAILRLTLLLGQKPARHIIRALRNAPPRNDVASVVVRHFLDTAPVSGSTGAKAS